MSNKSVQNPDLSVSFDELRINVGNYYKSLAVTSFYDMSKWNTDDSIRQSFNKTIGMSHKSLQTVNYAMKH